MSWAAGIGRPVIPAFILDEETGDTAVGRASLWWLHRSLGELDAGLRRLGGRLVLRRGPAERELSGLIRECGASAVVWNRLYDPRAMSRDRRIKEGLKERGIDARSFNSALLFEPWTVQTGGGSSYRVFTPFWRRCLETGFKSPAAPVSGLQRPERWPVSDAITDWGLPGHSEAEAGLGRFWSPGESGAGGSLEVFLRDSVDTYRDRRDFPAQPGTSRLSPHLHFGEIGPRQVASAAGLHGWGPGPEAFLRELGWREFSHHLLYHNQNMETENLRTAFDSMPWRKDPEGLERWRNGITGYPLVDAGMRELLETGWMHNRVRMIVASFLTKHLLIDWRSGADWFLETLVDADRANNSAGWQWVAGCGADAAPYHRMFNPVLQSKRFDAEGNYLRTWIPELAQMPDEHIHSPWTAPPAVLDDSGVRLGKDYPCPIVEHRAARERALAAYGH